jgi:hypothetical protein
MSRLVDQVPARICQPKAAWRSFAASRCSAIKAAFSSTDSGLCSSDGGGHAPVEVGAVGLELRPLGDRANQRVVEHILGWRVNLT